MELWLWLIFFAVIARAVYSLAAKSMTTHVRIHSTTLSTVHLAIGGLLAVVISPFFGGLEFSGLSENWPIVITMIVSLGLGNIIYYSGQDLIDAGTSQVALSTKIIWTALLAIPLLGSTYEWSQVLGMAILVGAVLVVTGKLSSKIASKGAIIIAISAVAFSVNAVTSANLASEFSLPAYLALSFLGAAVFTFFTSFKYIQKDANYIRKNVAMTAKYITFASVVVLIYFVLVYYAFRDAGDDSGLATILTNAQVVATVILASIVLKERDNLPRKFIAGILVLISAFLISGILI